MSATLLEAIAAGPLDGSLWSRGPAVVVGSVQSASVQCLSVLPHPQMLGGRLHCDIDHQELGTEVHGGWVGPHFKQWTTAEAVTAWARVRRCAADCGQQVLEGVTYCSLACQTGDKHNSADDYEPLGEAA